ncbi:G-type lectin S-receptor-like serine/threonine-protein kinase LECRK3 [Camellia lanceoleosa]|uniref:G-type lectin S-receptor-like serine/threonine-protein kinase LECRK3 n=1 Tax=Camellia lanceoleosa TaxID=1840588 RepID=A0ACC0G2K3_9ERIC|nr:G-type lectin S-receptor-like serine/threonine-protein kinase LECRK3 [Camellia lanceoleosa]
MACALPHHLFFFFFFFFFFLLFLLPFSTVAQTNGTVAVVHLSLQIPRIPHGCHPLVFLHLGLNHFRKRISSAFHMVPPNTRPNRCLWYFRPQQFVQPWLPRIFNDAGFMYILRRNNQRFDLTPRQLLFPTTEYYHRATLNFDGVFTQYYHPKSFDSSTKWTPIWSAPDNICLNINGEEGSGACGFNSICTLNEYKRPECKCPPGYSLLDPNNTYGSCKPNFSHSCSEDDINSGEELYDLLPLKDTAWLT